MPEGDGTGPFGTGAETSRRNGWQDKIDEATAFRLVKRKYSERNNKCKNTT